MQATETMNDHRTKTDRMRRRMLFVLALATAVGSTGLAAGGTAGARHPVDRDRGRGRPAARVARRGLRRHSAPDFPQDRPREAYFETLSEIAAGRRALSDEEWRDFLRRHDSYFV
jgi:hypothetical protein